jgi:3-methyl-2-oxobutanoate hydroxymethyltransferase
MYHGHTPRFVKRYAEIADEIGAALGEYVADVRSGAFPDEQHTYTIPDDELTGFESALSKQRSESK